MPKEKTEKPNSKEDISKHSELSNEDKIKTQDESKKPSGILDKEIKKEKPVKKIDEKKETKKEEEKVEIKKEKKEEPKKEIKQEVKFTPKRKERKERIGILNIYTTFNNTIMNLTDLSGKSIAKFGGGQSTKQDRLKANPTIAMFISQRIAEEARDNGITGFYVKIRAKTGQNNPGPGAHTAIKSLTRAGFKIISIMDTTRVPRGGPKKKGGRRGRRP